MVQNKPLCVCPVVHRLKRPGLPLHLLDRQAQLLSCRRRQPLGFSGFVNPLFQEAFFYQPIGDRGRLQPLPGRIMDPVRDSICKLANSKCFL